MPAFLLIEALLLVVSAPFLLFPAQLPALFRVACLALLGVAGVVGWKVARRDDALCPLALGLLAAMERLLHEEEAVSP